MINKLQISSPSCPIFNLPKNRSHLETEGLFGEVFHIKKFKKNWFYGFLETDGYYGWVHNKNLDHCLNVNYKIISSRSFILAKPDVKSNFISYLPMCSQVRVMSINGKWAEINYFKSGILKNGFIPTSHIIKLGKNVSNWKRIAKNLINSPYKWGGRDTLALDCSSLVQLICNTQNIFLPRNTNDQMDFLKKKFKKKLINIKEFVDINWFQEGCLIYWNGHVGIFLNKNTVLHANAYHNNVSFENIGKILKRFSLQNIDIKLICKILN